jgi:excisionase family DNA binding protein
MTLNQSIIIPDKLIDEIADKIMIRINDVLSTQRMNNTPDIMNIKQLCTYLGISKRWINDRVKSKSIPFIKLDGCLKFNLSDINKWLIPYKIQAVNKPPSSILKLVA